MGISVEELLSEEDVFDFDEQDLDDDPSPDESVWVEVVRWIQNLKKIMKAHLSIDLIGGRTITLLL